MFVPILFVFYVFVVITAFENYIESEKYDKLTESFRKCKDGYNNADQLLGWAIEYNRPKILTEFVCRSVLEIFPIKNEQNRMN